MTQVSKEDFYKSFKDLTGITTGVELNGDWVVRHYGKKIALSRDRRGLGDEDYEVTEYFIIN